MAPVVDAGGGDPAGQADVDLGRSDLETDPADASAPTEKQSKSMDKQLATYN